MRWVVWDENRKWVKVQYQNAGYNMVRSDEQRVGEKESGGERPMTYPR